MEDSLELFVGDKQYALNLQNRSESLESERKSSNATRHCSANKMDNVAKTQYSKSKWEGEVNWDLSKLTDSWEMTQILTDSWEMA